MVNFYIVNALCQNFILSLLEVGHLIAQTWTFFDKFHEITDFGPLQQP